MAVNEHSLGPLYVAAIRVNRTWCPPSIGDITEMEHPWRRGKAVIFSVWPSRSLAVGIWVRMRKKHYMEAYEDEQWLVPRGWPRVSTGVTGRYSISQWSGPDEAEEAQAVQL